MAEWEGPTSFYFLNDTLIPFVSLLREIVYIVFNFLNANCT